VTERVPRHISPYCPQNSAYTDWFCPSGSVCSIPHEKCHFLLDMHFLLNQIDNTTLNFTQVTVCFLSLEWCKGRRVSWTDHRFGQVLQSVAVWGLCAALPEKYSMRIVAFLVTINVYELPLYSCEFWTRVFHPDLEKQGNYWQKIGVGNRKVSEKSKPFQMPQWC
jgi:hypothetical protein